jgi:hypothetical protein
MVARRGWEGVWLLVDVGFSFIIQGNKRQPDPDLHMHFFNFALMAMVMRWKAGLRFGMS